MPPVTPTSSTPPRHRHGNWPEGHPSAYPYEYDNGHYGYSRGNLSPGGPPAPPAGPGGPSGYYPGHHHPHAPRGSHPTSDYWQYESSGYYDIPPGSDRETPEASRLSRGVPHRPPHQYQAPNGDHRRPRYGRAPASPHSTYNQGQGQGYGPGRDSRHPRGYPPTPDGSGPVPRAPKDKRTGDPLSILANVSAGMTGKDGRKQNHDQNYDGRRHVPIPAPTSPLQRRTRPSPITPNHTPQDKSQRVAGRRGNPSHARSHEHPSNSDYQSDPGYGADYPSSTGPYYSPRRRGGEFGPPYSEGTPPALVEHGSFDSQGEMPPYRDGPYSPKPPPGSHYYNEHPPPYGYWDAYPPPQASPAPYPPPRWNYNMAHEPYPPEYSYENHGDRYPYHRPPVPLPIAHQSTAPYTYVQQPRLEEKTVLRKKFSWKHYPELERFLIANRDEYLKHSNMNYTAEQKQYNNWLTERLLEVAGRHNYVFDPDDFNFVAIRDRIRCYYKSYVQTARKRGLKLPEKKD